MLLDERGMDWTQMSDASDMTLRSSSATPVPDGPHQPPPIPLQSTTATKQSAQLPASGEPAVRSRAGQGVQNLGNAATVRLLTDASEVEGPSAGPTPPLGGQHGPSQASQLTLTASSSPVHQRSPGTAVTSRQQRDLKALEARMQGVAERASKRAEKLVDLVAASLEDLEAADTHLGVVTRDYERAYGDFERVLNKVTEDLKKREEAAEMVQSLLIAGTVMFIGPTVAIEGLMVKFAAQASVGSAGIKKLATGLHQLGLGLADEYAEMKLGQVMDREQPKETWPSDTAARGGPSAGQKFKEAYGYLSSILKPLPKPALALAKERFRLERLAMYVRTASMQVRHGESVEPAEWSPAELVAAAATLEELDQSDASSVKDADADAQRQAVGVIRERILAIPRLGRKGIETRLWTSWLASLGDDPEDWLESDVLQAYLGVDFGWNVSAGETHRLVTDARRTWLRERGIDVSKFDDWEVRGRYESELARATLKAKLVGAEGRVATRSMSHDPLDRYVEIAGEPYPLKRSSRFWLKPAQRVVVVDVLIPHHLERATLERWTTRDFELEVEPRVGGY
jgi:hypothetical protein